MTKLLLILFVFSFFSCHDGKIKNDFLSSRYNDDLIHLQFEQKVNSPDGKKFIGIFYDDSKSMSGIKIIKLYNADSLSVDELYYGAHPLLIENWNDSVILMKAGVFSAHGDSVFRKLYLDGSVDKNTSIGEYKIEYKKDYNFQNH